MAHPTVALEAAFGAGPAGGPWMTLDDVSRGVLDTAKLADDSLGTGFWVDLGDRADRVTIKRGRQRLLDRSEPGRMTAELDNDDRELDPTNLNGTFVAGGRSLVKPMRPVRVRATHTSGPLTFALGNTASTPHDAAYDGDDIDVTIVVSRLDRCLEGGAVTGQPVIRRGTGVNIEWEIQLAGGIATLTVCETPGSASHIFVSVDFSDYVGSIDTWTIRVHLDTDDDAGSHVCHWEFSSPLATFTEDTMDILGDTGTITLPNNAVPLYVGGNPESALDGFTFEGRIHSITAHVQAVPVAEFRASDWDAATHTTTARTGETWTAATYTGGDSSIASVDDEVYDLFRGYADNWEPEWREPDDSICHLTATDGFKVLARVDRNASGSVGSGEPTGLRVQRILDHAEWPADDRDLDIGETYCQATTLSQNALTELYLTADTERGELYVDGQGHIVFRSRHHRYTAPHSLFPRWVLGNAAGELQCTIPQPATDDDVLVNRAEIGRVGGTVQTAEDATSIEEYLLAQMSRSDLIMITDAEAVAYAATVVQLFAEHDLRFDHVTLEPSTNDLLWPVALGAEIGDRLTIRWTPPGGGDRIERDVFIEGIEHEINVASTDDVLEWRTTFRLSDAERWEWFVLDSGAFGVLDTNRLGY